MAYDFGSGVAMSEVCNKNNKLYASFFLNRRNTYF
jgi:hypothetical protein